MNTDKKANLRMNTSLMNDWGEEEIGDGLKFSC